MIDYDFHIGGNARIARFLAIEATQKVAKIEEQLSDGKILKKHRNQVLKAIKDAEQLLGYLHRIEHALVVRDLFAHNAGATNAEVTGRASAACEGPR